MATHPTPETHAPPVGCRTLCQYPGCGRPIEVVEAGGSYFWSHPAGDPDHEPDPVEQPQHDEARRLVASVVESYQRHRQGGEQR